MSIKLMSEIWDNDDKELVGSKLIVLLCLADHANDDGVCWPSIGKLAKRARIDRRNVINHVNDLEAMGYIKVEHRPGNRNIYNVSPKRTYDAGIIPTHDAGIIPTHDATVIPTYDASIMGGMMPASYKPSVNHQLEPSIEPSTTTAASRPAAQDELALAAPSDSPTSSPRTEKKSRTKKERSTFIAPDANNYHREMFAALAALCKVDQRIKRGQLGSMAKTLLNAGYKPADLDKFSGWWYSQDFRGQQGKPPTIALVGELILQAMQWVPWAPQVAPTKKNGYSIDTLRSWYGQHCYERWHYGVAVDLGHSPYDQAAFKEWYENDCSITDDELEDWYKNRSEGS